MKEVLDAIVKRRSIRSYTGEPIEDWQVENLVKAFMYAPSGHNYRPWHLIIVKNRDILIKLSQATPWGGMLKSASLAFVVLGDPNISNLWIEDCSAATENVLLEATHLGLGSCWVQVRDVKKSMDTEEEVRRILGIPEKYRVLNMIAIGVPQEIKPIHTEKEIEKEKIHYERFGNHKKR